VRAAPLTPACADDNNGLCVCSAVLCCVPCRVHRGKTCAFTQESGWGVCTPQQAANAMKIGRTLGGGGALKLAPCDIVPFLRGRTLWILG
jgi:hypothetical protein